MHHDCELFNGCAACVHNGQPLTQPAVRLPPKLPLPLLCLQAGGALNLEWGRGRVFDQDVGALFAGAVRDGGSLRVSSVSVKDEVKGRPPGLNTVELLKVASSALNIGPAHAMQVRQQHTHTHWGCVQAEAGAGS